MSVCIGCVYIRTRTRTRTHAHAHARTLTHSVTQSLTHPLRQVGIVDIFLSRDHKIPLQWFAISDVYSDEPAIPTGYIRSSLIINRYNRGGVYCIYISHLFGPGTPVLVPDFSGATARSSLIINRYNRGAGSLLLHLLKSLSLRGIYLATCVDLP